MAQSTCGIAAMGFYLPEKEVRLLELAEKADIPVMVETVRNAMEKAGILSRGVSFFSMVNANLKVQELLLEQNYIPVERSSAVYLKRFGHFGGQDIFFNLNLAVQDKKISNGDYIALMTTGIVFTWGG